MGRDEARREIGERTGKGSGYDNSPMLAGLHFTRWNIRTSAFYPRPFANCKPRTRVQIFYPCRFQQISNHLIISFQTFYIDRNVRPHPLAILRRKLLLIPSSKVKVDLHTRRLKKTKRLAPVARRMPCGSA